MCTQTKVIMKNIVISALLKLLIVNAVERSTRDARRSNDSGSNTQLTVNNTRFFGEQRVNVNEIFTKRKLPRDGLLKLSDLTGINFSIGKIGDHNSGNAFGKVSVRAPKIRGEFSLTLTEQSKARVILKRFRKDIESNYGNKTGRNVGCAETSLSCRDCCAPNPVNCTKDTMFCRCDAHCAFYNDCCSDYETFCGKKRKISFPVSHDVMSCIVPGHVNMRSEFSEFWMVNNCPKDRLSDEASRKCAIADELTMKVENLRTLVPVVGENNLTFLNEFCAKCNGAEIRDYFGFVMKCFVNPPSSIISLDELLKFASKYCTLERIFRKDHQFVRECNQESNIHRCDLSSSKWDGESDKVGSRLRGPFESMPLPVPSFTVVLRLSKGTFISEVRKPECPIHKGQFYDPYLETCRAGEAISPVKKNFDKFDVVVWINVNEKDIFPTLNEIASSLTQTLKFERAQMTALQNIPVESSQSKVYKIVRFTLRLTSEQSLNLGKANHTTSLNMLPFKNDSRIVNNALPLRRLLFFSGEFNLTLFKRMKNSSTFTLNDYAIISVFKTTSRPLACIQKQTYSRGAYTSIDDGKYYYINSTGKTFAKNKVFFKNESISICEQIIFSNCVGVRVKLTSEEYVKFDNLSIFYNRTNTVYDFGEYDIEDGQVFMCIPHVLKRLIFWTSEDRLVVETYLTIICLSLSLACLYLVIQTYLVFPELRNLPGKNLLSLSISLFLAQLFWLIPDRQYPSTLCHIAAVLKHYLFLVTFVAMAAIAWHTHAVFVSKHVGQKPSAKNRDRKTFFKYLAIVWGIPAIFVVTCAIVEKKDIYAVYVNEAWCWFDNEQAQKHFFILPVGLLQLFNIIFFALTVFRIYRDRSRTRSVCGSVQSHKTLFWIYLKLSSLMGFSWLFGFVNLLVEHPAFSYLFVIFASLQGVYIAVAFVMKKTIWRKYMRLLGRNAYIPDYRCTLIENLNNSRETRV